MSTYINPSKLTQHSDYNDCPALVVEYLHYSETIRGLSPRTVNAYYIDLRTFFKFLKWHRKLAEPGVDVPNIPIADIDLAFIQKIDKSEIYEFLYYVTRDRENSSASRARKLSSLKGFFKYLTSKTNKLTSNPVEDVESPTIKKKLPMYLSLDESMELLNHVESDFYERDYCIITLFLNCGLRVSELVNINLSDFKDDSLRILGKGNKERIVYLNESCLAAYELLKKERSKMTNLKDDKALFVSRRTGRRLSVRRVQQIVEACFKAAGLDGKGYSVHKLRHTAATLMYRYGQVDLLLIKEILGHADLSTTQIYTHLDTVQLKNAANASPLSQFQPKPKQSEMPENTPENE